VIRAIERYVPTSETELSFEKGDFFHVIGNENDNEWYEACNPATGARGFVPVPFFQVIGKNERDSDSSSPQTPFGSHYHTERYTSDKDSGYSERVTMLPDRSSTMTTRGGGGKGGAPLYGVVLYDFNAERPDELEAKTGEPIIVIAQSNDEWFVAKPIGRLGGPGLIPVEYIEIRDMVTGKAVDDPKAAVARAGVPKVEEWKKMAAEYKNSSIALGTFDEEGAPTKSPSETNSNRNSRGSLSQGLLSAPITASVDSYNFENGRYWYMVNATMEDGRSWSLCRFYEDFYDFQIALLDEFKEEAGHTGHPRKLPYMPGPVTYVTDTISAARKQSLDEYIKKLLSMAPYISKCRLVKLLFAPRPGDVETTHYRGSQQLSGPDGNRRSQASQLSSDSSREPSRQSSAHNLNGNSGNGYPGLSAPPPRTSGSMRGTNGIAQAQQVHYRSPSDLQPPRMMRNDSAMSSMSGQFVKIKIEYQDEMFAVRLPVDATFQMLQAKLNERLGTANLSSIQYKDEASAQVLDMASDADFSQAISRNPKLKLFVS
ncbi:hypothetical protein BZA77DRAFT_246007, partial [Pyronema omphalodes]